MSENNGWLPIETAPKDGTYIQLWRGSTELGVWQPLVYGRWHTYEDGESTWVWPDGIVDLFTEWGRADADNLVNNGDCWADDESFTHWQPLPPPPETHTQEA